MKRVFCILVVLSLAVVVLAAETAPPTPKPEPPKQAKQATPLELYRNFETQQAQLTQAAQQLQAEYIQKMRDLQTAFDQIEGAKGFLMFQNPELKKQLEAEVAKTTNQPQKAPPPKK